MKPILMAVAIILILEMTAFAQTSTTLSGETHQERMIRSTVESKMRLDAHDDVIRELQRCQSATNNQISEIRADITIIKATTAETNAKVTEHLRQGPSVDSGEILRWVIISAIGGGTVFGVGGHYVGSKNAMAKGLARGRQDEQADEAKR